MLDLSSSSVTNEILDKLAPAICSNKILISLILSHNEISASSSAAISSILRKGGLLRLDLSFTHIGNTGIEQIAPAIANSTVQTLSLVSCKITCTGAGHLYTALKRAKLRNLILDRNNLSGGSILILRDTFRGNALLESLHINHCDLTSPDLATLADGLHKNTMLTTLSLHHNYVQSPGLKMLCEALSGGYTHLNFLDLSSNQIDDEGGKELGKMLCSNRSLKSLNLRDNALRQATGVALVDALTKNRTVENIALGYNSISIKFV